MSLVPFIMAVQGFEALIAAKVSDRQNNTLAAAVIKKHKPAC
jgi:hypothetical protein